MPELVRVASAGEVPPGEMIIVEANGEEVVIANLDGEFVCFSNSCTHRQGPMGEGMLLPGSIVECPFHGGQFNARTGEVVASPPEDPLPVYRVQVDGDDISVEV
ncbi:MAG TPA: non-heme iron oxygenase ferredoxin subunit [Dehalococcoidia bacterium]|nr:non-heme iron oxygenase ferredoxin subunit [Dehalococcoidia bacterium]